MKEHCLKALWLPLRSGLSDVGGYDPTSGGVGGVRGCRNITVLQCHELATSCGTYVQFTSSSHLV